MNNLSPVSRIIRHRRSVKPVDLDVARDVSRALLEHILEDAIWAPNHGMTEPWRFVVFGGSKRAALADALQSIYRSTTPPTDFREDKLEKLGQNPLLAPIVIAACMIRSSGGKIPAWEEESAVSCAIQNLMLSATAEGLATFWSSPPLLSTSELKSWLGLTEPDKCLGLIYLGWPKAELNPPKSIRKPLSTCVEWHQ
ncbi:MAG: nitroreductase [Verrucomicrobiaceae bacterium]|nr:nitroreductase [Verrucomicrobiaceae bacterium]